MVTCCHPHLSLLSGRGQVWWPRHAPTTFSTPLSRAVAGGNADITQHWFTPLWQPAWRMVDLLPVQHFSDAATARCAGAVPPVMRRQPLSARCASENFMKPAGPPDSSLGVVTLLRSCVTPRQLDKMSKGVFGINMTWHSCIPDCLGLWHLEPREGTRHQSLRNVASHGVHHPATDPCGSHGGAPESDVDAHADRCRPVGEAV